MTQDEIIEMAMKSGCPRENAFVNFDILQDFAKLVEERTAAKEREKWNEEIYQLGYKTGFREGKQHESQSSF